MATLNSSDPYSVVESVYITEKATTLAGLAASESNRCVRQCKTPKAVFLVNPNANKQEIAKAIEAIYKESKVTVVKVNTINVRAKPRRVRGKAGFKAGFRKAIVTFEAGDSIEGLF
jgi:large subunit ribosomal protein L23